MNSEEDLDIVENRTTGVVVYVKKQLNAVVNTGPNIAGNTVRKTNWWMFGSNLQDIYINGNKTNFKNLYIWVDKQAHHRLNVPARIWDDGSLEWWIDGIQLSPEKEKLLNIWYSSKNNDNQHRA